MNRDKKSWKQIKAEKRKWKEEKLLNQMAKEQKLEEVEVTKKQRLLEDKEIADKLGRLQTLSIALPGSILDNAQTPELRSYLAGQIARAAAIFRVDEVVVFDETGSQSLSNPGSDKTTNRTIQLARILTYLECPQYLRKFFFPIHHDLKHSGLLNPLAIPHHMSADTQSKYREGVVTTKPVRPGQGSYVNVGLKQEVQVDKVIKSGSRVTVEMLNPAKHKGRVVAPTYPRLTDDMYWGYNVRIASCLSDVFTKGPHSGGYDLLIGTSERGTAIDKVKFVEYSHAIVVFGGLKGLEASLDADQHLTVEDPADLFDVYINACPDQGSNTIRTEEAILIALSALRPKFNKVKKKLESSTP